MTRWYNKLGAGLLALSLLAAPSLLSAGCMQGCECNDSSCNCDSYDNGCCDSYDNGCCDSYDNGCCFLPCCAAFDDCCPDCCGMPNWCEDLTIRVDFLVWRPSIDDLEYAAKYDTDITSLPIDGTGEYQYLHYKWKPGLRVTLEKDNLWCGYDFAGVYTYVNGCEKRVSEVPTGGTLVSTLLLGGYNFTAQTVTSQHDLAYHQLDLMFGTDFCWCDCYVAHPYLGVGGLIVVQDIHHEVVGTTSSITGSTTWHNEYWGVGLEAGNRFSWCINDCWSFFGNVNAVILAGDNDQREIYHIDNSSNDVDLTVDTSEYVFVPGCHIGVGLEYEQCYCGRIFTGRIGYDFTQWYNLGRTRNSTSSGIGQAITNSPTTTTIGLHGFSLGVGMEF